MVAVAVAVVPTPTDIPTGGIAIESEVDTPEYPVPPSTRVRDEIVPDVLTLAVKLAAIGTTLLSTTNASTFPVNGES